MHDTQKNLQDAIKHWSGSCAATSRQEDQKKKERKWREMFVCLPLTGAHRGWPVLGCTTLPVGAEGGRVLQTSFGRHIDDPGMSVSSTGEAAPLGQRTAAAPHGVPTEESPYDPGFQEMGGGNMTQKLVLSTYKTDECFFSCNVVPSKCALWHN